MNDLAVAVIAHNRPNYLYVTLEALFAVRGIENCDVSVYCDGGLDEAIRREQSEVAFGFPIERLVLAKEQRGCLVSVTEALYNSLMFRFSKEVLYIESDVILRPDTLEGIAEIERDAQFYNLCWGTDNKGCIYTPVANVVPSEVFLQLYWWIKAGNHIGMIRPGYDIPITEETTSHDGVFNAYVKHFGLETRYPDKPYAAHFGLRGMNHGLNETERDFEAYMFSGPKYTWLPRIVRIIERKEPIPEAVKEQLFLPPDFVYAEDLALPILR